MSDSHTHSGKPCDAALSELYRYLDGELDLEVRALVEAHLRDCAPCLEAFDFEAELRRVIAVKSHETCPEHLKARILELLADLDSSPG